MFIKSASFWNLLKLACFLDLNQNIKPSFASIKLKFSTYLQINIRQQHIMVLHMCFERFLLAFESRDISQADKCLLSQTEWWVVELLFMSLRPEAWTFCKMNFVNPIRFTSQQEKLSKVFTFQACKFLSDKMTKTILSNCQIAFLGIIVIYYWNIEAWERRHSSNSLVSLR